MSEFAPSRPNGVELSSPNVDAAKGLRGRRFDADQLRISRFSLKSTRNLECVSVIIQSEDHLLAFATACIAEAGWRITRQRKLTEELEARGRSTENAERTLALMVTLLAAMRETQAPMRGLTSQGSIH
jgi:hypothetical protein